MRNTGTVARIHEERETSEPKEEAPRSRSFARRLGEEIFSALHDTGAKRIAWHTVNALLPPFSMRILRTRLLRWVGSDVRERVSIFGDVTLLGPRACAEKLRIGPGSIIGPGVVLGLDAEITLGKNVSIGPYALLHTGTHAIGPASCRMDRNVIARPIAIEDGVWIGMRATILPGVRVGRGAVVAAGAVVFDDVPSNTFVSGNPAKPSQSLPLADR
jgi:acetyltransferase-like isoleucine patch superfamily enzyme